MSISTSFWIDYLPCLSSRRDGRAGGQADGRRAHSRDLRRRRRRLDASADIWRPFVCFTKIFAPPCFVLFPFGLSSSSWPLKHVDVALPPPRPGQPERKPRHFRSSRRRRHVLGESAKAQSSELVAVRSILAALFLCSPSGDGNWPPLGGWGIHQEAPTTRDGRHGQAKQKS